MEQKFKVGGWARYKGMRVRILEVTDLEGTYWYNFSIPVLGVREGARERYLSPDVDSCTSGKFLVLSAIALITSIVMIVIILGGVK